MIGSRQDLGKQIDSSCQAYHDLLYWFILWSACSMTIWISHFEIIQDAASKLLALFFRHISVTNQRG